MATGDYIYGDAWNSNRTRRQVGMTSTIRDSIASNLSNGNYGCIVWDGTNLWNAWGGGKDKIFKFSGFSTTQITSFAPPSTEISDIATEAQTGTNLYSCDSTNKKIYKHAGWTSTITSSFTNTRVNPCGLAVKGDGTSIYVDAGGGSGKNRVETHAGIVATVSSSVKWENGWRTFRLDFDGTYFYMYDSDANRHKQRAVNTINASFTGASVGESGCAYEWAAAAPTVTDDTQIISIM